MLEEIGHLPEPEGLDAFLAIPIPAKHTTTELWDTFKRNNPGARIREYSKAMHKTVYYLDNGDANFTAEHFDIHGTPEEIFSLYAQWDGLGSAALLQHHLNEFPEIGIALIGNRPERKVFITQGVQTIDEQFVLKRMDEPAGPYVCRWRKDRIEICR